ncbi:hypothetical protein JCM11251_007070 [Rhodosporidiobolus azoricus]
MSSNSTKPPQPAYPSSTSSASSHVPYSSQTQRRPSQTSHYGSGYPSTSSTSAHSMYSTGQVPPPPPPPPGAMPPSRYAGSPPPVPPLPPAGARAPAYGQAAAEVGGRGAGGHGGSGPAGTGGSEGLRRNQTYAATGQGAGARAGYGGGEPEWRESSFISSFYGGEGANGTPASSYPTSPARGEHLLPAPAPPAYITPTNAMSGPAYPSYAIARSATIASASSNAAYPSYSSASYARPTAAPPVVSISSSAPPPAPQPFQQASYTRPAPVVHDYAPTSTQAGQSVDSRQSMESHYSLYSYGSEESVERGLGKVAGPPPPPAGAAPAVGLNGGGVSRSSSMGTFASPTANGHAGYDSGGGIAYPSRKQSLEHLNQAASGPSASSSYRSRLDSLNEVASTSSSSAIPTSSSTSTFSSYPPPSASTSRTSNSSSSSYPAPPPVRQPTILMSPPLDSAIDSPDLSSSSVAPQHLHRNRSIDASWQGASPGPSPSYPTFASSLTTSSPEVSRRPSVATLSPGGGYGSTLPSSTSSYSFSSFTSLPTHPTFSSPTAFRSDSLSPSLNFPFDASSSSNGHSYIPRDPAEFINPAFLSHLAVYLKDHVPRGTVSKGGTRYGRSFTGEEVVTTVARALPLRSSPSSLAPSSPVPADAGLGIGLSGSLPVSSAERERRSKALDVAQTLQRALWFHEVSWSDWPLEDSAEAGKGVYTFLLDATLAPSPNGEGEEVLVGGGEELVVETPTGVLTEWTRCESAFCGMLEKEGTARAGESEEGMEGEAGGGVKRQSCYSYSCPNRRRLEAASGRLGGLHRTGSNLSGIGAGGVEPIESAENWATSVPPSVLEALSKKEIALQNNIFELIQGEQQYWEDLGLLETGFIEPLTAASPPIIPPNRLPAFLSSVLLNHRTVRAHSASFLSALRAKQAEAPVVSGIGKIVFSAALEWEQAYYNYGVQFELAGFILREEMDANPRFREFVQDFRRHPSARRNELDYFLRRSVQRHSRYPMQLETILKHTDDDGTAGRKAEIEYLQQAYAVIHQQLKEISKDKEEVDRKVKLREFNRDLVRKSGDMLDLELLHDDRRFFRAERVYRRPEGSGFTDQFQEQHLVLFDNYLVLTKAPREDREGRTKYPINRRPVPLDLVQLKTSSFSEPPVPRSSGFHLRSNRSAGTGGGSYPGAPLTPVNTYTGGADLSSTGTGATFASSNVTASGPLVYPITFYQLGRFDGLVHFYVDTPAARAAWEVALKEAISLRLQRSELSRVVRLEPLADTTFGTTSLSVGSLVTSSGAAPGGNQFGKPTCSVPLRTVDGLWLVIAGCAEGIFIGWRGRPKTMQQVVHLAGITQCAVLPDFSFLLVIANKVLVAYALEALIPSKTGGKLDQASKAPQRLSGQKDVSFFKVGKIGDQDPRTLVIYAKKSGVKESVFKALEPVSQAERARSGGGGGHRFLGLGSGRPEWFRTYKEFFMPSLVTGLHFQRSKLALIGSRGVEIMDLETMRTMTVPDFPSSRTDRSLALLAKRCEDSQTMGLFRIGDSKFLLVYSDLAFHVGRHGEPVEGPLIEWDSKPEQIAYCAPYIFAISPTLVEIRHAFTGRLAQFITGSHMYLTYDGSAIPSSGLELRPDSSIDLSGPVDRRLHLSTRQGQFHVLHEVVIVA